MRDKRLLGTWRSDRRKTARDIKARNDIPAGKKDMLIALFGNLTLTYTPGRCRSTFRGSTESWPYEVVGKNAHGALIVRPEDPLTGDASLQHINFEGKHYWVSLGAFREYFRKITGPPNNRLQRTKPARATKLRR